MQRADVAGEAKTLSLSTLAATADAISFTSLAVIAAMGLVTPLALGLTALRLPAIVLEILLGIAIGPQGLGTAKD